MTTVEFAVSYPQEVVREPLPSPKFRGIDWIGVPEQDTIIGQEIEIEDQRWLIEVVGFQGSLDKGEVQLHQEPTQQEDVYFLAGQGEMDYWDGLDCGFSTSGTTPLRGVMTVEQAERAKYTLAVASYRSEGLNRNFEHIVLNVEIEDKTIPVEPAVTPTGHWHGTTLNEPSLYFVVKRKRI